MSMPLLIIICLIFVIVITCLFLTAVNWGYKVKQTVDEVTHQPEEHEVKK